MITRDALGLNAADTVLLMVGSLIGTKSQLHAIAAFAECVPRWKNLKLVIAGPPHDRAYADFLHRAVRDRGLDASVRLLGETDSVFDLYRLADAFFCTSLTEGWSLAMTEAMHCGLPVITTNVGGAAQALTAGPGEPLGILVPPAYRDPLELHAGNLWSYCSDPRPRNLPALQAAIEEFLREPLVWKSRAKAGPERVQRLYSSAAAARMYDAEIKRILREHYGDVAWTSQAQVSV